MSNGQHLYSGATEPTPVPEPIDPFPNMVRRYYFSIRRVKIGDQMYDLSATHDPDHGGSDDE